MTVEQQARRAAKAALYLGTLSAALKNRALRAAARGLERRRAEVVAANRRDLEAAEKLSLDAPLRQRLQLSERKIDGLIAGIEAVMELPDPVGRRLAETELDKGLLLVKESVPIGLIGVIFESRPDALIQIGTLCLKSGNAVVLKGGSEALHSNRILFQILRHAAGEADPRLAEAVQLVETRKEIGELLRLDDVVDLLIPRGSSRLVRSIRENTRIPVLGHSDGVCHIYIDRDADVEMAVNITRDAKCQYPAVCNAVETLLVHRAAAPAVLPPLARALDGVELRGDEEVRRLIPALPAAESDWETEYNDLILALKTVRSMDEAVEHINSYGSRHTDAIVTESRETAEAFLARVDSSSVMWNCSTRFADGYRYGFGAEVGISTNKIHARGPVGLEGLSIYKYKVYGAGQVVADYVEGRRRFSHGGAAGS
jgi:glutamate-5-semialdehyde dehydrogenase